MVKNAIIGEILTEFLSSKSIFYFQNQENESNSQQAGNCLVVETVLNKYIFWFGKKVHNFQNVQGSEDCASFMIVALSEACESFMVVALSEACESFMIVALTEACVSFMIVALSEACGSILTFTTIFQHVSKTS